MIDELVDRYGPLPEAAQRLVAVARLRLLFREYGITELSAVSESTLRLSPLQLADSQQLRLKRLYPGATYRATTSTVQVPIPRVRTFPRAQMKRATSRCAALERLQVSILRRSSISKLAKRWG